MINWNNITDTIAYYSDMYTMVDIPWTVDRQYTNVTCPNERFTVVTNNMGDLVGSAEQSFVQQAHKHQLKPGRYMAVTPCFRNEDVLDRFHQQYFMKLELFDSIPHLDVDNQVEGLAGNAMGLFDQLLRKGGITKTDSLLERKKTTDGYDVLFDGIELGSYGVRKYDDIQWLYGTGIAEPRFSSAINFYMNS